MGGKCGRHVGDKCKLSPKMPEWETSVGNKWETSVNSCAPRHPECVGDKLPGIQSGRYVWEISGKQM